MATSTLISADQFDTMSFDHPVELIRGEIVEMNVPGAAHGAVCINVAFVLENWARRNGHFVVLGNDTVVQTRKEPDSVRGPDVLVLRKSKIGSKGLEPRRLTVPPEIAIEVKSPSNSWQELIAKSAEFLAAGVSEVWIIDPAPRHVHVHQVETEPTILEEQDTITSQFLPEFSCQISEFFLNVAREDNP